MGGTGSLLPFPPLLPLLPFLPVLPYFSTVAVLM